MATSQVRMAVRKKLMKTPVITQTRDSLRTRDTGVFREYTADNTIRVPDTWHIKDGRWNRTRDNNISRDNTSDMTHVGS